MICLGWLVGLGLFGLLWDWASSLGTCTRQPNRNGLPRPRKKRKRKEKTKPESQNGSRTCHFPVQARWVSRRRVRQARLKYRWKFRLRIVKLRTGETPSFPASTFYPNETVCLIPGFPTPSLDELADELIAWPWHGHTIPECERTCDMAQNFSHEFSRSISRPCWLLIFAFLFSETRPERWYNPEFFDALRGVRIGEAANPGPMAARATARKRNEKNSEDTQLAEALLHVLGSFTKNNKQGPRQKTGPIFGVKIGKVTPHSHGPKGD